MHLYITIILYLFNSFIFSNMYRPNSSNVVSSPSTGCIIGNCIVLESIVLPIVISGNPYYWRL